VTVPQTAATRAQSKLFFSRCTKFFPAARRIELTRNLMPSGAKRRGDEKDGTLGALSRGTKSFWPRVDSARVSPLKTALGAADEGENLRAIQDE
jgi:hypothetical protein